MLVIGVVASVLFAPLALILWLMRKEPRRHRLYAAMAWLAFAIAALVYQWQLLRDH